VRTASEGVIYKRPLAQPSLVKMPSLASLPPEILSQIALFVSLETATPPVDLLLAKRSFHASLSPQANPRLYAKVFESSFEVDAAYRRRSLASTSTSTNPTSTSNQSAVKSKSNTTNTVRWRGVHGIRAELERRVRALSRLAALVRRGKLVDDQGRLMVREADMWVVYIMLIENGELRAASSFNASSTIVCGAYLVV
jgi:hypothetical protein